MAEKMGGGIKLSANSKALFSERQSVSPHPINKKDECDKKKNDVTQEYLIILILKFKQFNIQYVMYVDNSVINI